MPASRSLPADALGAAVVRWHDEFAQQGVLITDEHLVIRGWNRWLELNSGHRAADVVGQPLLEVFPDLKARGFEPYYRSALIGEVKVLAQGFHRYVIAPEGRDLKEVRQSGRITPLFSGGVPIGTVTVIEDVSERIATERELRSQIEASEHARALAEHAVRVKDEFLATLSHEMRTPLNAVIGWTQILRSTGLDQERMSRALEVIDRNATAQVRLIDDMLDTARIMSGKLRLESQPVDLARIALAAIDVVSPTAAAKQVTIVSSPPSGVMPMLGDPDRLQQIVWNLLANAIKFTPSGGRVSIGLERGADTLQLSVDDSGEGISPEFLPHLFKRFQQADPSSNRRHAGLGLGLSLVRQLVELHGGRIGVTSTVGVGSTFTVTFPSRPELDRLAGGGADGRPPANAMLSNIRVLVVADDPDSRDLLTAALDHHGAQVEAVPSAEEGLPLIAASHYPHVLVASVHDADPDAALIRTLETLSAGAGAMIPAIAVTSKEHPEQTADLLAAGYRIHLAQPLSPPALVSAVLRLARGR
jgi:PAS domain S-box-containing protein